MAAECSEFSVYRQVLDMVNRTREVPKVPVYVLCLRRATVDALVDELKGGWEPPRKFVCGYRLIIVDAHEAEGLVRVDGME